LITLRPGGGSVARLIADDDQPCGISSSRPGALVVCRHPAAAIRHLFFSAFLFAADAGDARRRSIHLTAAGESALDRVDAVAMRRSPCRHLTRGQLEALRGLLHSMLDD
jgi:hypothetical protein